MDALPKGIRESQEAVAETIENNVRKLIIDESPINPKYYETMSSLLDALIAKHQAHYFETSSKAGNGVGDIFLCIVEHFQLRDVANEDNGGRRGLQGGAQSKGCC